MRVTLCLGGSVIAPEVPDVNRLRSAALAIRKVRALGHDVLVVVGGGKPSREFIAAAHKLGASRTARDLVGIDATRLNARLLIMALGRSASREPIKTFEDAVRVLKRGEIPVMGGTRPGHTTDTVAAILARTSKSDLLIFFTDVGGVYTMDPKMDPKAKKLDRMTARELVKLVSGVRMEPGMRAIVDPAAARVMERSRIPTSVLGPKEFERLPAILKGSKHSGTAVVS